MGIQGHKSGDGVGFQRGQLAQQSLLSLLQIRQYRPGGTDGQRQVSAAKALQRSDLKVREKAVSCILFREVARIIRCHVPGNPLQEASEGGDVILVPVFAG